MLSKLNHSVSKEDYWEHWAFYGKGLPGEIERTGLIVKNQNNLKEEQKLLYKNYCEEGLIPLFPNVQEIIKLTTSNKKSIIASNTDSSLVKKILGSDSASLIQIVGGEGLRKKPSPDIFLKASRLLNVKPQKCLVFEDAWKGVEAAKAAGMPVVLVRNKYNSNLKAENATLEIPNLHFLFDFLGGQ